MRFAVIRRTSACATEGLCSAKYLGGHDFPIEECRAVRDRDCEKSVACTKQHRCHSDGDACVK